MPIFVPIFVEKALSKEEISLRKRKCIFYSKIPESIDIARKTRNPNGLRVS